jgi:hypothetical protein
VGGRDDGGEIVCGLLRRPHQTASGEQAQRSGVVRGQRWAAPAAQDPMHERAGGDGEDQQRG